MDSLNKIDYREPLIDTDDDFVVIDRGERIRSNTKDKVSIKKECVCLVLVSIISVILLISLIMSVASAAFIIHFVKHGDVSGYIEIDAQVTEVGIIPGHYVLVQYDIKENTATKIIGSILQFSLNFTSFESQTDYVASIYKTDCSSSKEVQPFPQLQPVNRSINFTACVNQTCLFDNVYEVASNESKIEYSITNDDYNVNEPSEFLIIAYQQEPAVTVTTLHSSNIVKSTYMTSRNLTFTLSSEDIQKSTYHFFGIKLIKGSPTNTFTITRSGVHVFYNASHLSPICMFNATTSCSLTIGYGDSDCIFTHFTLPHYTGITDDSNSNISSDLFRANIHNSSDLTPAGYSIICSPLAVIFLLLIVIVVIVMCIYKKIKRKRKANRELNLQSSQSVLAEQNLELTTSGEESQTVTRKSSESYCSPQERKANRELNLQYSQSVLAEQNLELTTSSEESQTVTRKSSESYCPPQVSSKSKDKGNERIPNLKIQFNERGLSFRFNQYGPVVDIPKGAVKGPANLQYGTSHVYSPGFRCEGGSYEPVSSFTYMYINEKLLKPVRVYVPIDVICEDTKGLVLLCKGHEKDAVFKVKDVSLSLSMGMVSFELSHFCEFCIALDKKKNSEQKRKYYVAVFTKSKPQEIEVALVIMCSVYYLKKLTEYYTEQCFKYVGSEQFRTSITEEGIVLAIPQCRQWEGYILGKDKITISDADVYKYLRCSMESFGETEEQDLEFLQNNGNYPPRFNLVFKARPLYIPNAGRESVPLCIHSNESAAQSNNDFKYNILLESELVGEHTQGAGIIHTPDASIEELCKYVTPVLVSCYYNFGLNLGISVLRLNEIEGENSNNIQEKCIPEILKEWKRNWTSLNSIPHALKELGYPIFSSFIATVFESICAPQGFEVIESAQISEPLSNRDSSKGLKAFKGQLESGNISMNVLDAEPKLRHLIEHVLPHINDWKVLGCQLGVDIEVLNAIEREERGDNRRCFMKAMETWKQLNKVDLPFKWETIIKVLYKPAVKGYVACEEIYKFFKEKPNDVLRKSTA